MVVRTSRMRHESELDYTRDAEENSKILLKEKYELLKWTETIELKTPNLFIPSQIAYYVEALPFCKITISPIRNSANGVYLSRKADRFALMNHSRRLDVYSIDGEKISQESSVQVLEDEFAEYCLLAYSASGSLLLSTRSSAQIDVFDHLGGYCYNIPLEAPQSNFDLLCAVSSMTTIVNTTYSSLDEKYMDVLYVLQYNGSFSVFKIGRLTKFYKMWSVSLDIGLAGSFITLPQYHLLLVSSHYRISGETKPGGLCSFRLIESDPYVEPIKIASDQGGWLSRLPFSPSNYAFLASMSINESASHLASVSTNGDFFLFEIPSTHLVFSVYYLSGPRPVQVVFIEDNEVAVLFDTGDFIRTPLAELREALHSVKPCEKFTRRTTLVTPCSRELFILASDGNSPPLREVATQRTSLACRLWIYTLWSSFKQLVGMAIGDAATPLQKATHSESIDFSLWHSPTRTLQQLFERTLNERNYSRAKELAASYESIDADIVLKREWRDVCHNGSVTVEHVDGILRQITDEDWILNACVTSEALCKDVQKALVDLGSSISSTSTHDKVRIHHNARMLNVCDDVTVYLQVRKKSCLEAALHFAQVLNAHLDALYLLADDDKETAESVRLCNTGSCDNIESVMHTDFCVWARARAEQIDAECGLPDHSVALMSIAVQHGFEELKSDVDQWLYYGSYVAMCSLVNENCSNFFSSSTVVIIEHLSKLTENELVRHAPSIISLLDWKVKSVSEELRDALRPLLISASRNNIKVLKTFRNECESVIDKDLIIECLCNLDLTGVDLFHAVHSLNIHPELASALTAFHSRAVKPTFKQLWDSITNSETARRLLIRVARCGQAKSVTEWETLRDDVVHMAESIYSSLVSTESALEIVTRELLSDEYVGFDLKYLELMLSLDRNDQRSSDRIRLGVEKSSEVLLEKSADLMQEAIGRGDPLLAQARFLANAARDIAPKAASDQLKILDTIDLVHELGSLMKPVVIKFAEPNGLLEEVVRLGNNYKQVNSYVKRHNNRRLIENFDYRLYLYASSLFQGKKCARLAVLLGVETPVATALSHCALCALSANDEDYLKKYIVEVIAKARNIFVVHQLCLRIIESPYVPTVMEDIYACALLNTPDEEMLRTLELIEINRAARKGVTIEKTEITDRMILDEMYVRPNQWERAPPLDESVKSSLCSGADIPLSKRFLLTIALQQHYVLQWLMIVENYGLRMKSYVDMNSPRLTLKMVESIPPSVLIAQSTVLDKNITAFDRIATYGCDRERFIEDVEYRQETIIGLAMSEDEVMFSDALILAADFKMDDWTLHMASLENALTSLSIVEAKTILKNRGHLVKLRSRTAEFHTQLRLRVFPLLESNEQFIAYLSLFAESEPEKMSYSTLKKIIEKKRDLKAKLMFTDACYLSNVIVSIPDKYILSLVDGLREIPVGPDACKIAADMLLDGSDIRPPANPIVIHALVGREHAAFLDLIANKSLSDEIMYLRHADMVLAVTPQADEMLKTTIRNRLFYLNESCGEEIVTFTEPSMLMNRKKQ
uniref:Neuroblastoma-amplified sequence n=1 Tax=Heterorhabditis bacteriophora TaxID=37862 RepID=A0A1I7XF00_HETBA